MFGYGVFLMPAGYICLGWCLVVDLLFVLVIYVALYAYFVIVLCFVRWLLIDWIVWW